MIRKSFIIYVRFFLLYYFIIDIKYNIFIIGIILFYILIIRYHTDIFYNYLLLYILEADGYNCSVFQSSLRDKIFSKRKKKKKLTEQK